MHMPGVKKRRSLWKPEDSMCRSFSTKGTQRFESIERSGGGKSGNGTGRVPVVAAADKKTTESQSLFWA